MLFIILLALLQAPESFALVCGSPGSAGPGSPTGVVNDYWAGSGSPSSGSTSITLGLRRSGGAGSSISTGDLILIIQIQDADIRTNNNQNYGGSGGGSGVTAVNRAGVYEYVRATNSVGSGGGALSFTPALSNSYRTRNYGGSNGQSRWQAIRVPQYSSATASNVTAPAWNGATGGVVALDVEGNLTLSAGTAINVAGRGFRGGAGRELSGGSGSDTDYRTLAITATNASKGEGIAGTPRYVNGTTSYNAPPTVTDTGVEGYPNGSYARGAPGNAGGGGTDGNPSANDQNSGGGGGSNYGYGGQGGDAWSSGDQSGGRGGADFDADLSPNRVFLGGGGGAGTTNNGTSDNATYSNPPGVACTAGNGACSSGSAGGGIVLIRAASISGGGLIDARGADAYNVENDGGGGGGGGGTVVLQTYFGGNASVNVSGGNGGNAWRSQNSNSDRHGPGGGGGGGYVAYSPSSGFLVTAAYSAGLSGRSSNDDPFGSSSGNGGISTFDPPAIPGIQPGFLCQPAIKAVSIAADSGTAGEVDPGDTVEYTIVYQNVSSSPINGFNISDTLATGLTFVPGSLTVTPSDGASGSARSSYNGTTSTRLLASNVTLPVGGVITARLRATVGASSCGDIFNQANSIQSSGQNLGATDNADSSQNAGTLPAGDYISQSPYGTSGASNPTGFSITCPDLATSTKGWVDLDGDGEQNPGDTLRYTITVTNSGGYATGVTVTDHIPAHVNSFTVVSLPAGAVDGSTGDGTGDHGNGYLNITDISVPAAGSVEVVFDVTINNNTGGAVIDNSATVTNPNGPGGNPAAPTVNVTDDQEDSTGSKPLYLYGDGSSPAYKLSRTPSTGTSSRTLVYNEEQEWTLDPALTSEVTISPSINGTVPLDFYLARNDVWIFENGRRNFAVSLNCPSGGTTLSQTFNNVDLNTTPTLVNLSLPLGADMTCPAGERWILTVRNLTTDTYFNLPRNLLVYPAYNGSPSRIVLPSKDVIHVESVGFFDTGGNPISTVASGSTVRVRAVVSDPFGSYDISAAQITILDPNGDSPDPPVTDADMGAHVAEDVNAGTRTFEFDFVVPSGAVSGDWTATIEAFEGLETYPDQVTHSRSGIFEVTASQPLLMVLKSASSATASPGQDITYTVQVVNTGAGPATNVILTDHMSPYTAFGLTGYSGQPFQFVEGSPPSGLTLGTPEYSDSDGSTWTYAPVSGAGSAPAGYDGNVTNWRIPMTGTMNADSATFTLRYRVQVK